MMRKIFFLLFSGSLFAGKDHKKIRRPLLNDAHMSMGMYASTQQQPYLVNAVEHYIAYIKSIPFKKRRYKKIVTEIFTQLGGVDIPETLKDQFAEIRTKYNQ